MKQLTLTITSAQEGRTVGSLMRRELAMAEGLISSAKYRPDGIRLNGVRVRVTARVHAGDILTVDVSDRGTNSAEPLAIPVEVVWEDAYFAVLNKPAGVSVYGESKPNLAGILSSKWGANIVFHPVNRLDVGTTGLMIAAKDGYTHDRLRRLLHTDDFIREYLAVAQGIVSPVCGTIEFPISRTPVCGTRRTVDPAGLPSQTDYQVLSVSNGRTFLRLRLHTGRTHQIRVHLAALGNPLVGDELYGSTDLAIPRPALHSHRILLTHPVTKERLDLIAPLPEDMSKLIS